MGGGSASTPPIPRLRAQGQPRDETVSGLVAQVSLQRPATVHPDAQSQTVQQDLDQDTAKAARLTFTKAPSHTHRMDPGDGYVLPRSTTRRWTCRACVGSVHAARLLRIWAVNARGAVSKAKLGSISAPSDRGLRLPLLRPVRSARNSITVG